MAAESPFRTGIITVCVPPPAPLASLSLGHFDTHAPKATRNSMQYTRVHRRAAQAPHAGAAAGTVAGAGVGAGSGTG